MALFINAVCDMCRRNSQPSAFDHDQETAADLKVALEKIGWGVEGGPGTGSLKLTCPACKAKQASSI